MKINKCALNFIMVLLILPLSSCKSSPNADSVDIDLTISQYNDYDLEQDAKEPVYLSDDLYIYDSLYFSENEEKIDKEDKLNLHLLFNNTTEYDVLGDYFFELEYYGSDDNWYCVPPTDYFFMELGVIYPTGEYSENYKLSDINYDFQKGKYRIIRKVCIEKYNGDCLVVYYFNL